MKNLLLIAFATLALCMGANVLNACPSCEGKTVVKAEKVEKAEVKKADVNADATADTAEATTKTVVAKGSTSNVKRASAGQAVRADVDCAGTCKRASNGQAASCDGCGCGGSCGGGCSGGCDSAAKADKSDCEGCGSAKKAEPVKN